MTTLETVEIESGLLPEIVERLVEKRGAVAKELELLGKPPDGRKNIMAYCRQFEKAFKLAVDSVEIAGRIKHTFNSNEGLSGAVRVLPVDKKFQLQSVKVVCREADGFQPHLVSPEAGLRRLIQESMKLIADPVNTTVRRIHLLLVEAARQAARNASKYTDTGFFDEKKATQFPALEATILVKATEALEGWREEALSMVTQLVQMEEDYVTAAFFRHAVNERLRQLQYQNDAVHQLADGQGVQVGGEDDSDNDDDDDDDSAVEGQMSEGPGLGRSTLSTLSGSGRPAYQVNGPGEDEFKMGYLQKRIGEHSGRNNLPNAWKWQKRWFVFTDSKGMLYYFKTADDPPNYRGVINIRDCLVEDLDNNGQVVKSSQFDLNPGNVSLLIKLTHKDPTKPVVKKHNNVVLKADTPQEKFSWLTRLKAASVGPGAYMAPAPQQRTGPVGSTLGAAPSRKGQPPPQQHQAQQQQIAPLPPSGEGVRYHGGIGAAVPFEMSTKLGAITNLFSGFGRSAANGTNGSQFGVRDEAQYDQFLEQLAEDTKQYVKEIFFTLEKTVPKAIVHTQVKRAEGDLLERLNTWVYGIKDNEMEALISEDPSIMQKRAAAKAVVNDIAGAIVELRRMEEALRLADEAERATKVQVPYKCVELSGMWDLLPNGGEGGGPPSPYGDYTPRALQAAGKTPFSQENGRPKSGRVSGDQPAAVNPSPKPRRRPPPAPPAAA